jgi:hypothetical protein
MGETQGERLERLRGEMESQSRIYGKLSRKFGPGVLETVKEDVIGAAEAALAKEKLGSRGLDAVMDLLWDKVGSDLDFQVLERTDKKLRIKVTRCMWADEMRALGAAETGFATNCSWDYGFCRGLNPAIRFTRTKTLMQGDDCCDHAYELE